MTLSLTAENLPALANWLLDETAPAPQGISETRADMALSCMQQLFLCAPQYELNGDQVAAFDDIVRTEFDRTPAREINDPAIYPKVDFLWYLVHHRKFLLHGSNSRQVDNLEPRSQEDWHGRPKKAIFATGDNIWPLFFALLDRPKLRGSIRNGCFVVEASPAEVKRFYFFSVNALVLHTGIWTDGFIHILPRDTFTQTSSGPLHFDEWASPVRVTVAARLPVSPTDFPFMYAVTGHPEEESLFTTWLRYKERLPDIPGLRR